MGGAWIAKGAGPQQRGRGHVPVLALDEDVDFAQRLLDLGAAERHKTARLAAAGRLHTNKQKRFQ